MCPAPGQGALGIETRSESHPVDEARDAYIRNAIAFLEHPYTRFAVTAERTTLDALGGGCQLPIGAHCLPPDVANPNVWRMYAQVVAPDGEAMVQTETEATLDTDPTTLGLWVANDLKSKGALDLLAATS
jgi:hydroxymethylbilane synthase